MPALVWLNLKRIVRGWRWRAVVLVAGVAAYWFSRIGGFGMGSSVWFPGGERGIMGFTIFLGLAGVILGSECLGQFDRYRSRLTLDTKLINPIRFLLSAVLAVTLSGLIPAALLDFWPVIGAWRADFYVIWQPNFLYLAVGALPVLFCGAAAGIAARTYFKADLAALALGILLLTPTMVFRIWGAPVSEIFQFASASFGILIPSKTILREAALLIAHGFVFLGAAAALLPRPRQRTAPAKARFFSLRSPILMTAFGRFGLQKDQWQLSIAAIAVVFLALGGLATIKMVELFPRNRELVDWAAVNALGGFEKDELPSLSIDHRDITLPRRAGDPLTITLLLSATRAGQSEGILNFGNTLEIESAETQTKGQAISEILPRLGSGTPLHRFRFDPPLSTDTASSFTFKLAPTRGGRRLWERAYDARYYRFSGLGPFYGASASLVSGANSVQLVEQSSPFKIQAPELPRLRWRAGAATVSSPSGSVVTIAQMRSDNPGKLIAADLVETKPPTEDELPVIFVMQPQRTRLAGELHKIYSSTFTRLKRLFGPPSQEIVLYEVPDQFPTDPLAIPSTTLDLFETLLPDYRNINYPTAMSFRQSFVPIHGGIVAEILTKDFRGFEHPDLLRDALIAYLDHYVLNRGVTQEANSRQDQIAVRWFEVRNGGFPFDIAKANLKTWRRPLFTEQAGSESATAPMLQRMQAFHHMLRGLLGDDAYLRALRALFQEHREEMLTLDLYRTTLEHEYGESLEWFFDQWINEGVVPRFQVTDAQALLIQNEETRALEYVTEVTITNIGTGSMDVPWVLVTEDEPITGRQWLTAGGGKKLTIKSIDRPVAFEVDPEGWIAQQTETGKGEGTDHARVFFKTVREL